jgi:ABC-type polysaccharide/polyol phosphate transport system ATPase subunit
LIKQSQIAVEVSHVHKSFVLPVDRPVTLKERVVHPLHRSAERELKVLQDISFKVGRGEFFGIVGRNGSGKSTLLKLLASVYKVDRGQIKVAGLVAPVVELGVGFQPDLTARENVLLNGLMLGLTPKEARRRFDAVIDFAELREFVDLKLKNYSSGMRARLAFAIAMQVDPDVLLLDEVLAVGDPPFQQRCEESFDEIKRTGRKTVLLVTHSTSYLERYCDRAMLLELGRIDREGDPVTIARSYSALLPTTQVATVPADGRLPPVRIADIQLIDSSGGRSVTAKQNEPIRLRIAAQADEPVDEARLLVRIGNGAGVGVFVSPPIDLGSSCKELTSGEQVGVTAKIENRLTPGRYIASCAIAVGAPGPGERFSDPAGVGFHVIADGNGQTGLVQLDYSVEVGKDPRGRPKR